MYSAAIENDIDPLQFWDMTLKEIQVAIEAKQKRLKTDMQISAIIAHGQAQLIGSLVSRIAGGKHKVMTIQQAFPNIFPEEVAKPRQQDWRIMKARMEKFANAKKKWGEHKRGNDDRGTPSTHNSQNERSAEGDGRSKEQNDINSKGDRGRIESSSRTV